MLASLSRSIGEYWDRNTRTMIDRRLLTKLKLDDLHRLVTGYTSEARYQISKTESDQEFVLALELVSLEQPYCKHFEPPDTETLERYRDLTALGFSFGAYDGEQCVGIALAEPCNWNRSLWVWELHVAETHRRRGVGRQLVEALTEKARVTGLRVLVCETQNTNVPAINFYRKVGFHIEGIDLSYYSNDDFPDGEIAVFMKKRLVK
jgi:streptothricin acetyltransferase